MLRLVSGEDVHDDIIRGLRRRDTTVDVVRAVDVGLRRTPDPQVLAWAAEQGRVLITGDLNTMVGFAWEQVKAGRPMPGVVALVENQAIGRVLDDLLLIATCAVPEDVKDQVLFVPL